MNLAIIFGSSSNEHEVSIASASSIITHLDKKKYHITPLYMNKQNDFFKWDIPINDIKPLKVGEFPTNLIPIFDIFSYLKTFDLVFIMIHGKNGEDGTLSSILDFLKIKYIAQNPESSIITMNKTITKEILEKNDIYTAPYISFTKYNQNFYLKGKRKTLKDIISYINKNLNYPLFIKPSRSGSSLGITRVSNPKRLKQALNIALKIDNQILIEEEIKGREIECAIIEHKNKLIASPIGEIKPLNNFYSFASKYQSLETNTLIPTDIPEEITKTIQNTAKKVFQILNCHIYSRVDFFLTPDNRVVLNEINTIPGFTTISMYPALFQKLGIPYSKLLDILITEALSK